MIHDARIVRGLGLALLLSACADRPVAPFPISEPPSLDSSALAPGDVIDIKVPGEPELNNLYTIGEEGIINFPHIGHVQVAGRRASEIEAEIQKRLAEGYLKNPYVLVNVAQYNSRKVTVQGEVKQANTFAYERNMTIVRAVSLAGGFTPMAKKNSVRVTRRVGVGEEPKSFIVAVEEIMRNRAPQFYLHPGDEISVPARLL